MAKLPSIKQYFKADNGEDLSFDNEVTVDNSGMFHLTIPPELKQVGCQLAKTDGHVRRFGRDNLSIGYRSGSEKLWVSGKKLDDCCAFIADIAGEYLRCDVTTERVIVYGSEIGLSAWKDEDGAHHPNGYCPSGGRRSGQWIKGELDAMHTAPMYRVGLVAYVADKVVYTRASGVKTVWNKVNVHSLPADSWLKQLNSFIGIVPDAPGQSGIHEMPYSEQAAMFFYNAMLGLCALADKIYLFLSDKDRLGAAIEGSIPLLPPPGE